MWVTGHDRSEIYRFSVVGGFPSTYTLTAPMATPGGIASGPDGALWFTYTGNGGGIGRSTTTGTLSSYTAGLTPGMSPTDIAAGPDGNLWFTLKDLPAVGRITTAGVITEFTAGLSAGDAPEQITAGPDGNLWVTLQGGPGAIARVEPATGTITRFTAGLPVGAAPAGIASGAGRVWFTLRDGNRVGSIGTDGAIEMIPSLGTGVAPEGIAPDTLGRIWFVGRASPARVSRIDPTGAPTANAPAAGTPAVAPGVRDATVTVPVNPNGLETEWHVRFGPTDAFGSFGDSGTLAADAGPGATVTARIGGLLPATTYRYQFVAVNAAGTAVTTTAAFTTADAPADAPPAPPTVQPVLGRSVIATPLAGTVTIRLPGSRRWLPLAARGGQIPVGSRIDARHGRVRLRTALRAGTQEGEFWAGRFTVGQSRRAAMVTLTTDRTVPAGCPRAAVPRLAALAGAPDGAIAKRKRRTLWGKDHRGRFRTHGYDSVATVRGTEWATIETCAGTITRVVRGSVSVRDLRAARTVLARRR